MASRSTRHARRIRWRSAAVTAHGTPPLAVGSDGAGLGGFYTPVGAGTLLAEGKEEREIDGVPHVFERPIRGDVALVYAANCQNLSPGLTTVPIDHPRAKAVQNIAPGRNTKYPQLVERLIETILSNRSADRFESQGFDWLAPPNGA